MQETKERGPKFVPKFTQLFINNEFVDAEDGQTFPVINPATEEKICDVQRSGIKDAEKAVQAARKAFDDPNSQWRKMSANDRGKLLYKIADLIEENAEELADLETQDLGKPYLNAINGDIQRTIKTFRYYAGWADKIEGRTIPIEGPYFCYTRQEPVGVCLQIIPWNLPLVMQSRKMAPALACGCVSILKPSEKTPLSALFVADLFRRAGFPPGVAQILPGYGDVGEYLVKHPMVDKIAFTGSTKVGQKILQQGSLTNIKRITVELGGKSPNIICHDADLDLAVQQSQFACFANNGQTCIAGTRLFVHEAVYDEFIKKTIEATKKIVIGNPFNPLTNHGPQIDDIQFKSILGYIEKGNTEGANCVIGGSRHGEKGFFIQPTVFTEVKDEMTIAREEIFGPVLSILKFSDYDEVIRRANDTCYGLGAGIVTKSIELYQKLCNGIRAGTVYVNCYMAGGITAPFGGFKNSGIGRENGEEVLKSYLELKTIIVKH